MFFAFFITSCIQNASAFVYSHVAFYLKIKNDCKKYFFNCDKFVALKMMKHFVYRLKRTKSVITHTIMTLSILTLSIETPSIMMLRIMTQSIIHSA